MLHTLYIRKCTYLCTNIIIYWLKNGVWERITLGTWNTFLHNQLHSHVCATDINVNARQPHILESESEMLTMIVVYFLFLAAATTAAGMPIGIGRLL